MQIIPKDDSWLRMMDLFAQSMNQYANRSENRRQFNEFERRQWTDVMRELGGRQQVEDYARTKLDVANPYYEVMPEVNQEALQMAGLRDIGNVERIAKGPSFLEGLSMAKPDGKEMFSGDAVSAAKADMARRRSAPDARDILQVLAAEGLDVGIPELSEKKNRVSDYRSTRGDISKLIEGAKKLSNVQMEKLKKWKSRPELQQQYLGGATYGDMSKNVIENFHRSIPGSTGDEIRKNYALAANTLNDLNTIFKRKGDSREMLGSLTALIPQGGGGGGGRDDYIRFTYGGETYSIRSSGMKPDESANQFVARTWKNNKGEKVSPEQILSAQYAKGGDTFVQEEKGRAVLEETRLARAEQAYKKLKPFIGELNDYEIKKIEKRFGVKYAGGGVFSPVDRGGQSGGGSVAKSKKEKLEERLGLE